jgi:ABC-type transport system involved in multi-copper enzyme maturation permease subunit
LRLLKLTVKEFRELAASRAYWLMLLMIGPLVGHAFITAVDSYAEASAPGALAQGLSPLDGLLVPTFGAYDIAVTLLFPFVAIRLVSAEKESGAWKLMLQSPASMTVMLAAKGIALLTGWIIAWIPGIAALGLWRLYGGSLYAPETLNLLLGHLLRVILSSGIAVAAAAIAKTAASAAIATLGFTVGTWALEFVAEGRGGWLHTVAAYTPTAALRLFEQGLFRLNTASVMLLAGITGFALAGIWLGDTRRRGLKAFIVLAIGPAAVFSASFARGAWDLSENRRNSFSEAEETALRQIRQPLRVTMNLAPEDPRLADLNRNVLSKLERIHPNIVIAYSARTRSGLFEGDHYGEVWYELGGGKTMLRSTTEPIVLETIFRLAGVPTPSAETNPYQGHPLVARPAGAAWIYYVLWPLVVACAALLEFRKRS